MNLIAFRENKIFSIKAITSMGVRPVPGWITIVVVQIRDVNCMNGEIRWK